MKSYMKQLEIGLDLPADSVVLPSKGKIYDQESFFYRRGVVEYKPMTPRQEEILMNSAYRKKNNTVDQLISSCLMESNVDISHLLVGDKNALMVAIRISGYGREYEPSIPCPGCEVQNDLHLDLSAINMKILKLEPEMPGMNLFKYKLPKSGHDVFFKFLTVADERDMSQRESTKINEFNTVTTLLQYSIVKINNIVDRNKIDSFIQSMNASDSNHLRKYINRHCPGLEMHFDFSCTECSHVDRINLPSDHSFFSLSHEHREIVFLEPFFLLGYYFGMDYQTYCNFPVSYRRWLVERIDKEIRASSKANENGASNTVSKGAHHNSPDARAMSGKQRAVVPAGLRRFT